MRSGHLKTLRNAGWVRLREEGRWIDDGLHLPQWVGLEQSLADS